MTAYATGMRSRSAGSAQMLSLAIFALAASNCHAGCIEISYAKLKPPVYPQAAIAAKAEGRVLVRTNVAIDGAPTHLAIVASSGNADLDQAALDTVATWRFNPRTCEGKAVAADVVVPVEFNLSQPAATTESTGVVANERPADAGPAVASSSDRELAPDHRPMDASTVPDLLKQLREGDGVFRVPPRAMGPAATLSVYFKAEERAEFEALQSKEHGWDAVHGAGWTSIIRTRFVDAGRRTFELYAQLCDGDTEWCEGQLAAYLERMLDDPPLIPPPALPRSDTTMGRGSPAP